MPFQRPSMLYNIRNNVATIASAFDYPIIGKPIIEASRILGVQHNAESGAGFLGLRLPDENGEERWLVCSIWCADNWVLIDDRIVHSHVVAEPFKPYVVADKDEFAPLFADRPVISEFVVERRAARLVFGYHVLEIDETPHRRPPFPSGTPREFMRKDDLRKAWVITNSRGFKIND